MRRKVLNHEEKFQEAEIVESWSKARLVVALLVFGVVAALGYVGFAMAKNKATQVLGARSVAPQDVKLPSQEDANHIIENARHELDNLTAGNLTSSQAALQRIITDLQALQGGKQNPTDLICHTICGK